MTTAASQWLNVRVTKQEREKADALLDGVLKTYPVLTRAGLVREALRIGLAELAKNPKRALLGSAASGGLV